MKTGSLSDLYLPKKVAYHVKILIGALLTTVFFNLIWKGRPVGPDYLLMCLLVFIQLEIFMFLAFRIFNTNQKYPAQNYKRVIIIKLLKFYLLVFLIAIVFLFLVILTGSFLGNQSIRQVVDHFLLVELKPFLFSWLIGISLGSLIFFYLEWTHALKREQKLREEKLIFKYETLKNQVNPHFLFNSLNTLSSLVSKDPVLAEKYIQKFSSIYRYILENNDVEMVNLKNEISFVKDYFYLQEIRDNGKIVLKLSIDNQEDYMILPISAQLLVENALKHNAASLEEQLVISFSVQEEHLIVENNLRKKTTMDRPSGKGLINLSERILLTMKKPLSIMDGPSSFIVKVPLKKTAQ